MDFIQCLVFVTYDTKIALLEKGKTQYTRRYSSAYVLFPKFVIDNHKDAVDFLEKKFITVLRRGEQPERLLSAVKNQKCEVMEIRFKESLGILRHTSSFEPTIMAYEDKENKLIFKRMFWAGCNTVYRSSFRRDRPKYRVVEDEENVKILETILAHGADIHYNHINGGTFLHFAYHRIDSTLAALLLRSGANINAQDNDGNTCLHKVIGSRYDAPWEKNTSSIIESLLRSNANAAVTNNEGRSALHTAIVFDSLSSVKLILESSLNLDRKIIHLVDNCGYTPLHLASIKGRAVIANYLIKAGADLHALATDATSNNFKNATPLHFATKLCCHDTMKVLLDNGADVNVTGFNESTVLQLAINMSTETGSSKPVGVTVKHPYEYIVPVSRNLTEIIELLLLYRPNFNLKSNKDSLFRAMALSNLESTFFAKILTNHELTVDSEDIRNPFAVHGAVSQNSYELVKKLFSSGADVNVPFGQSLERLPPFTRFDPNDLPLHTAARIANDELIVLLLRTGADVNAKNSMQNTPLMLSIIARRPFSIIETLVNAGANVHATNLTDQTVLHLACAQGLRTLVGFLLKNGANVNAVCSRGKTPIFEAVKHRYQSIAYTLIEHGADIRLKDKSDSTLLHELLDLPRLWSIPRAGVPDMIKLLVGNGVDLNTINRSGTTPLYLATKYNCQLSAVKVLMKFGAKIIVGNKHQHSPLNAIAGYSYCEDDDQFSTDILKVLQYFFEYDFDTIRVAEEIDEYGSEFSFLSEYSYDSESEFSCTNFDKLYQLSRINSREVSEFIFCHSITLTALGFSFSNDNLEYFQCADRIMSSSFPGDCATEVAKLKQMKVGVSDLTFFDIVTKGTSHNSRFARNESIVQVLKSNAFKSEFPIYGRIIELQFQKGLERRELLDECLKIFHSCSVFSLLPFDAQETILGYLTNQELFIMIFACTKSEKTLP